jgi:hypothetical protein
MDVATQVTDVQKQKAKFTFLNRFGKPAAIQGLPLFTADKQGVVSLFPSDDGSSCDIVGLAAGVAVVSITVTAASGTKVTASIQVTVTQDPDELEVTTIAVALDPATAQ